MNTPRGLRIVVCVKQVPVAGAVEFDTESGVLRRDGVRSEVNTYDVRALLAALDIRDAQGGEVVALTMGPPDADAALRYCLALGADRAVHLCDRGFAGADTLATARALALAVEREAPDLVLCGRSSTDAETGNVGPEIAELLSVPQVTAVCGLEVAGDAVIARRETEDGFQTVRTGLPAVLVVGEDVAEERFPSKEARSGAAEIAVEQLGVADLGGEAFCFGFAGSPTAVESVQESTGTHRGAVLVEADVEAQARRVIDWLWERAPGGSKDDSSEQIVPAPVGLRSSDSSVCVYVEIGADGIRPVSRELLAVATRLAEDMSAQVDALVIGSDVAKYAPEIAAYGADRILIAEDGRFDQYDTMIYAHVVTEVIRRQAPRTVLFPSTTAGRDLAPRCAARMAVGLTADCVDLRFVDGQVVQDKPAFGDGLIALITSKTSPELATVRPGVFRPLDPRWDRKARVERITLGDLPAPSCVVIDHESQCDAGENDITTTDIVIGVGNGATHALAEIRELARLLGASIGCTRKVADQGVLPRRTQIGLTGHAIAPRIYIAIGARGAHEHVVGLSRAQHVLAIDTDEDSFMFDHADLGIVQECELLLPLLIQLLREKPPTDATLEEDPCTPASLGTN